MKNILKIMAISLFLVCGSAMAQKVKYSKNELKNLKTYYFNEGFVTPATKKVSTVVMKDGSVINGYCKGIKSKRSQIHTLVFKDSVTGESLKIPAEDIAEAFLFASNMEKIGKAIKIVEYMGTSRRSNMTKATTDDQIYFVNQSVSLKNKKEEQEFLMQLINPNFDDLIAVYFDPRAHESQGYGVQGLKFGGGTIMSYYIKKDDRIFWLRRTHFKEEYENLFGDNEEFMKKYPYKSVDWDYISALVLEYTKMTLGQES